MKKRTIVIVTCLLFAGFSVFAASKSDEILSKKISVEFSDLDAGSAVEYIAMMVETEIISVTPAADRVFAENDIKITISLKDCSVGNLLNMIVARNENLALVVKGDKIVVCTTEEAGKIKAKKTAPKPEEKPKPVAKTDPEKTAPAKVILAYFQAMVDCDGDKMAGILTDDAVAELVKQARANKRAHMAFGITEEDLEKGDREFAAVYLGKSASYMKNMLERMGRKYEMLSKVIDAEIEDEKATVTLEDPAGNKNEFGLVKIDGEWKLDKMPRRGRR